MRRSFLPARVHQLQNVSPIVQQMRSSGDLRISSSAAVEQIRSGPVRAWIKLASGDVGFWLLSFLWSVLFVFLLLCLPDSYSYSYAQTRQIVGKISRKSCWYSWQNLDSFRLYRHRVLYILVTKFGIASRDLGSSLPPFVSEHALFWNDDREEPVFSPPQIWPRRTSFPCSRSARRNQRRRRARPDVWRYWLFTATRYPQNPKNSSMCGIFRYSPCPN